MQKQSINSPRLLELKRARRRSILWKIFLGFIAVVSILSGLVYLSRLQQLNISEIAISGNKVAEKETMEEVVRNEISGYYLWIFPKRNIFMYPKDGLKDKLKDEFKIFKFINLSISENKVLEVEVIEREGLYTWCGTNISSVSNEQKEKCYFLDKDGYIFDEAPFFSGEVYFKFYTPTSENTESPIGSSILEENFKKLISFKDALSDMELKPAALYTKDNKEFKMYLTKGKTASLGPEIIFPIEKDLENLAVNLETALTTEPMLSNFKNKYSSLEYIDLRFGNKVYYRFK